MTRVWFVNRFYHPSEKATAQLLSDLTLNIASDSVEVHVVCSRESKPISKDYSAIHVHPIARSLRTWIPWAPRALDLVWFFLFAWGLLLRRTRKGDVLVVLSDPPFISYFVPVLLKRRCRCVFWVQDIYPEVLACFPGIARRKYLLKPFQILRNRLLRGIHGCVTISSDMAAVMAKAGVSRNRIFVSPNWSLDRMIKPSGSEIASHRASLGLSDKFVICYSGNFGHVHELSSLPVLARTLSQRMEFVFLFIGSGPHFDRLAEKCREMAPDNTRFVPPVPRDLLAVSLAAPDVHLITQKAECADSVFPSKLYGVAAVGKPVIFIGSKTSDVAREISAHAMGAAFEPSEVEEAAAYIVELSKSPALVDTLATNSKRYDLNNGGVQRASRDWAKIVSQTDNSETK